MEEKTKEFRRRLAQINGIKLNESKARLSGQGNAYWKEIQRQKDQKDYQAKIRADYHRRMADNVEKGLESEAAHDATLKALRKAHGPEVLKHMDLSQHFYEIGRRYRDNTD